MARIRQRLQTRAGQIVLALLLALGGAGVGIVGVFYPWDDPCDWVATDWIRTLFKCPDYGTGGGGSGAG